MDEEVPAGDDREGVLVVVLARPAGGRVPRVDRPDGAGLETRGAGVRGVSLGAQALDANSHARVGPASCNRTRVGRRGERGRPPPTSEGDYPPR